MASIKTTFFLLITSCATVGSTIAQDIPSDFDLIGGDQGMPYLTLRQSILQDKRGLLWLGSDNGLMGYDGFDFFAFTNDHEDSTTISSNSIRRIVEDIRGLLWIATPSGLNRFDPATSTARRWKTSDGLSSNSLYDLKYAPDSILYIAGSRGIDRLNVFTGHVTGLIATDAVLRLVVEGDTTLLLAHREGIVRRFTTSGKLLQEWKGLPGSYTHCLTRTSRGEVLIGMDNGLVTLEGDHWRMLKTVRINDVVEDRGQNLWLTSSRDGMFWIDSSRLNERTLPLHEEVPYRLPSPFLQSTLMDRAGRMWISVYGAGLLLFDRYRHLFQNIQSTAAKPILPNNRIFASWEDRHGYLWLGCDINGMARYDPRTGKSQIFINDPANSQSIGDGAVIHFTEDRDGILWFATTRSGVHSTRSDRPGIFRHYVLEHGGEESLWVNALFTDRSGTVWAASRAGGLFRFDRSAGRFINVSAVTDSLYGAKAVHGLEQDKDGYWWAGSSHGELVRLSPDGRSSKVWRMDITRLGRILEIRSEDSARVWLGTDGGLYYFDAGVGSPRLVFDEAGTQKYDFVGSIERDSSGFLWIGTATGLLRLHPANVKENGSVQMDRYDQSDGLTSREFYPRASHHGRSGRLYFGGNQGLTWFDPRNIRHSANPPDMVITRVTSTSGPVGIPDDRKLSFDYDHGFVELEFSGIHFTAPEKVEYLVKLEGYDGNWISAKNRRYARYTNIPPGSYRFLVKAHNGHHVWSEPASIDINIIPPFWATWWFRLFVVLAVGGTAFLIISFPYRMRIRIEQLRTKIATDLHDRIGAGLTDISILSNAVDHMTGSNPNPAVKKTLAKITDITEDIMDGLRDIVWLINPQKDTLYDTVLRLRDHYEVVLASAGVSFEITHIEDFKRFTLSLTQRQDLYLLMKEAIHNATRHSGASKVWVDLAMNGLHYVLRICDNGHGLDSSSSGMGMITMQERATRLKAVLSIHSDGNGTVVEITNKRKLL